MLTGKDIGNLISQPEQISQEQLVHISELSEKYPYSQLFPILYLKGMHSSNSLDFETALQTYSYRISDRARLYELIQSQSEASQDVVAIEEEISEPEDKDQLELDETVTNVVEEPPHPAEDQQSSRDIELNIEESLETDSEIQVTESNEEIVTSESEEESTQSYAEEADLLPIDIPKDPLEESILHNAVAQHYQLDALTPEEEEALEQRTQESSQVENAVEAESNDKTEVPVKASESEENPHINKDVTDDSKLSFTGWLHSNDNYEEREDEQASIKAVVEEFSEFDPMESLYGEVEKPKKEFFSPSKKAKESLQEDQLPVSETLAKIYVMQGNYPKAIEAYNELILAFPEKKIFFANQIEDLQKKLNT